MNSLQVFSHQVHVSPRHLQCRMSENFLKMEDASAPAQIVDCERMPACRVRSGGTKPNLLQSDLTSRRMFLLPSFLPSRVRNSNPSISAYRSRTRRSSNENGMRRCVRPLPVMQSNKFSMSMSLVLRLRTSSILHPVSSKVSSIAYSRCSYTFFGFHRISRAT
jgi:hypothetical protein